MKGLGAILFLCVLLAGCGGGGGNDGLGNLTFPIGGTIASLDGTVVLQNNGGDALSRSADGVFAFATPLADGSDYSVTVLTQPEDQTCTVANGSGTVSGAAVTDITVTCVDNDGPPPPTFPIGGTIGGLDGTVVLQNNGGNNLSRSANGNFTFATPLADGSGYSVAVATHPDGQTCTVANNVGTVSGAPVTDITVTCADNDGPPPPTFSIGGVVSGLDGTVVLQNNGGDALSRSANGSFTFTTLLTDGSGYSVAVATQPAGQICTVTNGSGTVSAANVISVVVNCEDDSLPTFSIGGTISGLDGTVVLQNNGGDALSRSANGGFTFATQITDGGNYNVTIAIQPAGQICTVANGSGTVDGAAVTSVAVTCEDDSLPTYSIGGTVSGLDGTVVLRNNGGDDLSLSVDGAFTFATELENDSVYSITVSVQPAGQTCTVTNGSGTVSEADVTSVAVNCADDSIAYSIGGTVSGLDGTVVLQNNSADDLSLSVDGAFTFATELENDSVYSIAVSVQPAGQTCTVTNGSGTVSEADVTNVTVTCDDNPTFSIGGTISGLDGTVVLQNNGADDLSLSADDTFTFTTGLENDSVYSVTVSIQPAGQTCTVTNGAGTVSAANVTDITVSCVTINANLAALTLSNGELDQIFQVSQLSYTSTQPFPVASIQVTPTAEHAGATITVDGDAVISGEASAAIALPESVVTTVTIVVTAADGETTQTYTVEITRESGAAFAQQAYLKASNTATNDQFSWSVALSGDGNTLAVGAWGEDSNAIGINGDETNNAASNSGAVYVFTQVDEIWGQQAYVKASNTEASDQFGWSVALSNDGDTLAVGAWGEDSNATGIDGDQLSNLASNSGAAYVYARTGGVWDQQAYVKASNAGVSDQFGWSVALSDDGDTLAVGALNESSNATGIDGNQADNSAPNSGAVYVFARTGGVWDQQAYVKASNTEALDWFGRSVALSGDGDTLAVGATREGSNAIGIDGAQGNNLAAGSGAVYVFARAGGVWDQQAYVKASNTGAEDEFGWSVALSADGNTLAVGAYLEDSNATGIDGNQANNALGNSGAVYVFIRIDGIWGQQAYVKASNSGSNDRFGVSVALSGNGDMLAVGAIRESSNATGVNGAQDDDSAIDSGAAYAFVRLDGVWSQQAYVKASNTGAGDQFGRSVTLSREGDTLVAGAWGEGSNATGVNGDEADNSAASSGAAYVYRLPPPLP